MYTKFIFDYKNRLEYETVLRAQKNKSKSINMVNGQITANPQNKDVSGVSALIRRGQFISFAAREGLLKHSVNEALETAQRNLPHNAGNPPASILQPGFHYDSDAADDVEYEFKLEVLHKIDTYILHRFPKIKQRNLSLNQLSIERSIVSASIDLFQIFVRCHLTAELTAEAANGELVSIENTFGDSCTLTEILSDKSKLHRWLDALCDSLNKKCYSVSPCSGKKICVLGADPAAMLVHEAIGHTVEADLVLGGSVARKYFNQQIVSPLVTICDFANKIGDLPVPQPIYIDDEGVTAKDAILLKDGILKGMMHDRDSAAVYGAEPTGNARAYTYADEPLIRMRNTAVLPGKSTLQEMISSVDDGYYLVRAGMGQADTTGEFAIRIIEGYEIKHGKLGNSIQDTVCFGYAFETFSSIDMVGNSLIWDCSGLCGKGQPMVTAVGAPALRCIINIGG